MFIEYHEYKLRVSSNGIASYVTPEITIYRNIYDKRTIIYRGPYSAVIEKETPLTEEIITGEFFDKLREENPPIPEHPNTVRIPSNPKFMLFPPANPFIKVTVNAEEKVLLTFPVRGRKMGADSCWGQLDKDYRIYFEPRHYKTVYIPTLNGRASAKEKVYLADVIDRFHEDVPAKTARPLIPTSYVEAIDPDYVYINLKNFNSVYIIKRPLVILYSEFIDAKEAVIYYRDHVIKEIRGRKTEIMDSLVLLAHAGDGVLLL